jgi:hypothetical protein
MKLTQKITLALGLLAAGTSMAQTASGSSTGLLGQRYVELGLGKQNISHVSPNLYSVGGGVNLPLVPAMIDAGASYDYSWIHGARLSGHASTFGGYATWYTALSGVKPFVSAGLGWEWSTTRGFGSDNQGLWGLAAGVEVPVGALTLTPRISYGDDFEGSRNSSQQWTYAAEANYWINGQTGVFGSIGFTDVRASSLESWNYRAGVRVKF